MKPVIIIAIAFVLLFGTITSVFAEHIDVELKEIQFNDCIENAVFLSREQLKSQALSGGGVIGYEGKIQQANNDRCVDALIILW